MLKIVISGLGKAGCEAAKYLLAHKDVELVAAICSPGSEKAGKDLGDVIGCGETGLLVQDADSLAQVIFQTKPDVAIDFSVPEAALKNAHIFAGMNVNIVMATTGFSDIAIKHLKMVAERHRIGFVYAPNITLGVNVLMLLSNLTARLLGNYDFQISEVHHKHKKDSPSGTALKIAAQIEEGLKACMQEDETAVNVPITAARVGGVIGIHSVTIAGEYDKLEIRHESMSRAAFAEGALRAAQFVHGKTGYFEMSDVLGLNTALSVYLTSEDQKVVNLLEN